MKSILEQQLLSKQNPEDVFQIISILGKGSFGYVALCREKQTKNNLAIKFLEMQAKGNEIKSIVNEINILKESVECPYVVE